jgi:tetratricopeptide (TPR) repeat protein
LALIKAAPLRVDTSPESREELAMLLLRAAYGFALKRDAKETDRLASEVWALAHNSPHGHQLQCQGLALKAWAALLKKRPGDALDNARRAVAFDAEGIPANAEWEHGLRLGYNVLWIAASILGRTQESDAAFKAHSKRERSSAEYAKVAIETQRVAALGAHRQGDFAAAVRHLEIALTLQVREGASPQDRAQTLGMLARCCLDAKQLSEAESYARRALLLCEAAPDTQEAKLAHGLIHGLLGNVLFALYRYRECLDHAEQACTLLEASKAEWPTQSQERLEAAVCLLVLGSYQEAAERLAKLMDAEVANDTSPQRLVTVAEMFHSALLLSAPPARAIAMLTDVEQRLAACGAPEELRAKIQTRLGHTKRVGWLMPLLRPFSRLSGWLFRKGIYRG